MAAKRILLIEDDADLREGLFFSFASDGYEVFGTNTKAEGIREIKKGIYDLAVLDCTLPDGTGFELCAEVRSFSRMPIIMLTARDTEIDEIQALELGADDFLSKPFSLGVLKARIRRILCKKEDAARLVSGNIMIDQNTCRVYKEGKEIELSRLEYRLFVYLVENKNHVLSKEQILSRIWDSGGNYVDSNTVSVNISRLRTKLGIDASSPAAIQTVHGIGYIWKEKEYDH